MTAISQDIICVMGPTASGKTDLALSLAEQLNAEIVSVDSALVYRGLDIGSAKPSLEERARIPHHLIDIRDPSEPYSAAEFCRDAQACIDDIRSRGKRCILVGGTMLYFKALLEGLAPMPAANPELRASIEAQALAEGWPAVHARLAKVDPVSAAKIHPNHSQRLSRALEVFLLSAKPISAWQAEMAEGLVEREKVLQMALAPRDRKILHQRIAERFDNMLAKGFVEEVAMLRRRSDLHLNLPAMRAVGYRQVWQYLEGACDFQDMRERGIVATRQLAKRQLTWLRGWPSLHWIDIQQPNGELCKVQEIVKSALSFLQ